MTAVTRLERALERNMLVPANVFRMTRNCSHVVSGSL